jgi:hypothetical protein
MTTSSKSNGHTQAGQGARPTKPWMLWTGRVLSALPILGLLMSAGMKLSQNEELVTQFVNHLGYPASALVAIGVVELVCVVLYAIPFTSVLGAILLTGYLGGAIASHVRLSEAFVNPLVLGVLVWVGLYLRDARLRALLPLRR